MGAGIRRCRRTNLVHKHGGKYLSRSGNVKTLEGKPLETSLIAIIEFPSAKPARLHRRPRVRALRRSSPAGSESRFQLIDDTDLAGTIPYLAKG